MLRDILTENLGPQDTAVVLAAAREIGIIAGGAFEECGYSVRDEAPLITRAIIGALFLTARASHRAGAAPTCLSTAEIKGLVERCIADANAQATS